MTATITLFPVVARHTPGVDLGRQPYVTHSGGAANVIILPVLRIDRGRAS